MSEEKIHIFHKLTPENSHISVNRNYQNQTYDDDGNPIRLEYSCFNGFGISDVTGEKYDEEGYDCHGYDAEGYNRGGYNALDINRNGEGLYDFHCSRCHAGMAKDEVANEERVFCRSCLRVVEHKSICENCHNEIQEENYNLENLCPDCLANLDNLSSTRCNCGVRLAKYGYAYIGPFPYTPCAKKFDTNGICLTTGTKYDRYGFDKYGLNADGFDSEGYNKLGLDKNGEERIFIEKDKVTKCPGCNRYLEEDYEPEDEGFEIGYCLDCRARKTDQYNSDR